jgi:hypothetical protein
MLSATVSQAKERETERDRERKKKKRKKVDRCLAEQVTGGIDVMAQAARVSCNQMGKSTNHPSAWSMGH